MLTLWGAHTYIHEETKLLNKDSESFSKDQYFAFNEDIHI